LTLNSGDLAFINAENAGIKQQSGTIHEIITPMLSWMYQINGHENSIWRVGLIRAK
jgi:hypothetical protein